MNIYRTNPNRTPTQIFNERPFRTWGFEIKTYVELQWVGLSVGPIAAHREIDTRIPENDLAAIRPETT